MSFSITEYLNALKGNTYYDILENLGNLYSITDTDICEYIAEFETSTWKGMKDTEIANMVIDQSNSKLNNFNRYSYRSNIRFTSLEPYIRAFYELADSYYESILQDSSNLRVIIVNKMHNKLDDRLFYDLDYYNDYCYDICCAVLSYDNVTLDDINSKYSIAKMILIDNDINFELAIPFRELVIKDDTIDFMENQERDIIYKSFKSMLSSLNDIEYHFIIENWSTFSNCFYFEEDYILLQYLEKENAATLNDFSKELMENCATSRNEIIKRAIKNSSLINLNFCNSLSKSKKKLTDKAIHKLNIPVRRSRLSGHKETA